MKLAIRFEETAHYRLGCLALLLWWVSFIYPNVSTASASGDAMAGTSVEQGTLANQLLIFALAGMGLFHWPEAWRRSRPKEARNLILLALLYCGWSAGTYLWSEDPGLTVRRLSATGLMLIGCWGLGLGFYARTRDGVLTLGRHVMYATVIAALMVLPGRLIGLSLAEILSPGFNLKENIRAGVLTHPAGYAALAALAVFSEAALQRWATLALYFGLLVFMKGRTMLGDVAAAATVLASRLTRDRVLARVLLIFGVLQTSIYADLGTGGRLFVRYAMDAWDALTPILPWVTIGGGVKDVTSLNGRLPLWNALYDHIANQPLIGYGFGAFWTPDHLSQIFRVTAWHAVIAHNGFLDELLATGLIGLLLFAWLWGYGIAMALRVARYLDRRAGHMVVAWLILYLLFNTMDSINQSFFKAPFLISAAGLFTVAGCFTVPRDVVDAGETVSELETLA